MKKKQCHRCKACEETTAEHVVKFDCVEHHLCARCWNTFNKWFTKPGKKSGGQDYSNRVA